ncbi:hypothetical protein N7541_001785 [Penicillium brevicompactum]|uniref:Uncharacterized protein n=1 Tax=Penicillium brevicompactum TaxID=5074 RepID=A0A9W9RYS4_PENBR|nr:hypothetical protein N7541_001785 [Penicillium brevicompactum]
MPCDPELRYHFTDGMAGERKLQSGKEGRTVERRTGSYIVQGRGCQAVGDGRSPFGDSWKRQTASGAAKPDQSPLNQNRSRERPNPAAPAQMVFVLFF